MYVYTYIDINLYIDICIYIHTSLSARRRGSKDSAASLSRNAPLSIRSPVLFSFAVGVFACQACQACVRVSLNVCARVP